MGKRKTRLTGRGRKRKSKKKRSRTKYWIQKAIKRPGRVKRLLMRWYGKKAFTKDGEIKQSYLLKAKKRVKEKYTGKRRKSLLSAINLALTFEKWRKGK